MCQGEGHIDGFVFVNRKQTQIVDGDNDAHIAALVAFRGQTQFVFVAPNMQIGAELFELANDIGEIGGREREFGLVVGGGDFHHFGIEFNQGEFEMFVEGVFGGEMQKYIVLSVVILDGDLLALFACIENAKEELGVDTDDAVFFLFVLVEPSSGDVDFKDGNVRRVHALGIKPRRFKHEIDVFAKELHVLEHGAESLGFVLIINNDVHFLVGCK